MAGMTVACSKCGAPIWWAWTTGGKRMPLDREPDPDGILMAVDGSGFPLSGERLARAIEHGQSGDVTVARRAKRDAHAPGHPRWTSHFATCPNAAEFRRPRAQKLL